MKSKAIPLLVVILIVVLSFFVFWNYFLSDRSGIDNVDLSAENTINESSPDTERDEPPSENSQSTDITASDNTPTAQKDTEEPEVFGTINNCGEIIEENVTAYLDSDNPSVFIESDISAFECFVKSFVSCKHSSITLNTGEAIHETQIIPKSDSCLVAVELNDGQGNWGWCEFPNRVISESKEKEQEALKEPWVHFTGFQFLVAFGLIAGETETTLDSGEKITIPCEQGQLPVI